MQKTQGAFGMKGHRLARCPEMAPLSAFCSCGELDGQEKQQQIDAHLATRLRCAPQPRAGHEVSATLLTLFEAAGQMDPSEELLAQCRSELRKLLDDFSGPPARGHASPSGWARRREALRPMFG